MDFVSPLSREYRRRHKLSGTPAYRQSARRTRFWPRDGLVVRLHVVSLLREEQLNLKAKGLSIAQAPDVSRPVGQEPSSLRCRLLPLSGEIGRTVGALR